MFARKMELTVGLRLGEQGSGSMLSVWSQCPQKPEITTLSPGWVTSGSCPAAWGKER